MCQKERSSDQVWREVSVRYARFTHKSLGYLQAPLAEITDVFFAEGQVSLP